MRDESGGVLTFGAFDVVVFAAIVYLVTKPCARHRRSLERPKLRDVDGPAPAPVPPAAAPNASAINRRPTRARLRRRGRTPLRPPTSPPSSNLQSANGALTRPTHPHPFLTCGSDTRAQRPCSAGCTRSLTTPGSTPRSCRRSRSRCSRRSTCAARRRSARRRRAHARGVAALAPSGVRMLLWRCAPSTPRRTRAA